MGRDFRIEGFVKSPRLKEVDDDECAKEVDPYHREEKRPFRVNEFDHPAQPVQKVNTILSVQRATGPGQFSLVAWCWSLL